MTSCRAEKRTRGKNGKEEEPDGGNSRTFPDHNPPLLDYQFSTGRPGRCPEKEKARLPFWFRQPGYLEQTRGFPSLPRDRCGFI
jgi:hypothetical protein